MTVNLDIPDAALEIIAAAAAGYGWQPTITNDAGEVVTNPQTALERILIETINTIRQVAINTIAQQRAAAVRQQTTEELTQITNDWIESLGAS